jgi:DDB1- and CUL4-associated factor 1
LSGVFHPNGLEVRLVCDNKKPVVQQLFFNFQVISNTEVWDLRTFHLLRTVSTLDQCQVIFSPQNVIYAISSELEPNMDSDSSTYESSYKTLDMFDYSSISTIDVKKNVYDLCVNKYGSQIAVVENHGEYDSVQESVIRVYSVGRQKNTEDDAVSVTNFKEEFRCE